MAAPDRTPRPPTTGRRNLTAAQVVAEHIREQIFDAVLRSGDRIDRERLALETGTSAIPVREALIDLAAEGTVTIERQRGAFVTPFSAEDLEVESAVYGQIMGLAAVRAVETDHDAVTSSLRQAYTRMQEADVPREFGEWLQAYYRTINVLGLPTRSRRLVRSFVRSIPATFFEREPSVLSTYRKSAGQLLSAIESRDHDRIHRSAQAFTAAHAREVIRALHRSGAL